MDNHASDMSKRTVYFDDECELCERSARKVRDEIGASIVGATADLPRTISKKDLLHDVHAMDENGVVYRGVEAIIVILRWHPRWFWLAPVIAVPGIKQLTAAGYRFVADNRYRWFGKR